MTEEEEEEGELLEEKKYKRWRTFGFLFLAEPEVADIEGRCHQPIPIFGLSYVHLMHSWLT